MSLAEDLRRPLTALATRDGSARVVQRRAAMEVARPTAVIKDLKEARSVEAPAPDATVDSLSLLERASKSVVFLLGRYRQLEEHVRQLDAWSKAQLQAAEAAATRWQDAAAESDRKMVEMQRSFDALTRRAEMAEQALKRDREALTELQERINGAFGFGSEAHDALAAIELD